LAEHKGTLPKSYWDHLQEQLQTLIEPWLLRVTQAGIVAGAAQLSAPAPVPGGSYAQQPALGDEGGSDRKAAPPTVSIAWDLVNQDARRQAQQYTYDLVRGITDNTRQRLQQQVDGWIAAGNAFPDLVERIKPLIPDLEAIAATALQPDYRARLIAMTESTRAYADGNTRVWAAAGVWGREWRTAVDERVCPVCGGLHQQRAKTGAAFEVEVKGKRVVVQNPPAHPGCRCSVKPVVRPEKEPAGQAPRPVAGYTFFQGTAPSVVAAREIGESATGWAQHERVLQQDYLPRFKVEGEQERTMGLWSSAEPSFNSRLQGERENIIALAKEWGSTYHQDAMALLFPEAQGTGGKLQWRFVRPLTDTELDTLLNSVNQVNQTLAATLAEQQGLDTGFRVGLTVRYGQVIEYWWGDAVAGRVGRELLNTAISTAQLPRVYESQIGHYAFELLFRGVHY